MSRPIASYIYRRNDNRFKAQPILIYGAITPIQSAQCGFFFFAAITIAKTCGRGKKASPDYKRKRGVNWKVPRERGERERRKNIRGRDVDPSFAENIREKYSASFIADSRSCTCKIRRKMAAYCDVSLLPPFCLSLQVTCRSHNSLLLIHSTIFQNFSATTTNHRSEGHRV